MENDLPKMIGANTTILFDFVRTPKSRLAGCCYGNKFLTGDEFRQLSARVLRYSRDALDDLNFPRSTSFLKGGLGWARARPHTI